MNLIKYISLNFKKNAIYYLLAFCMISSAIAVIPFGLQLYALGVTIGLFLTIRGTIRFSDNAFLLFLLLCYISTMVSGLWDYRIFIFTGIILFMSPILSSSRNFRMRARYLEYSLYVFPIVSLISLYCYFAGINMMSSTGDVSWDFSALFYHSMWLGAANGLSNVVLMWLISQSKDNLHKVLLSMWLLASIFLSVVSGSRAALAASLIAMFYMIYITSPNIKKLSKSIVLSMAILFTTYPLYYGYADRILSKFEYQKENNTTSRDGVFEMRRLDFIASPIIGVGFSVGHHPKDRTLVLGRIESGSGWLSVVCQIGLLGILVLLYIVIKSYMRVRRMIRRDRFLQLLCPVFLFLSAHSCFEGYILTSGYYLCILFWGILSILYTYPIKKIR